MVVVRRTMMFCCGGVGSSDFLGHWCGVELCSEVVVRDTMIFCGGGVWGTVMS